jgi:hypothetical protein
MVMAMVIPIKHINTVISKCYLCSNVCVNENK